MKIAAILLALSAAVPASAPCQAPTKKVEAPKPMAVLEWLVGGVWTADASKLGPGMQRIETRHQWSDNGAYIRFTTHFVMDTRTLKNYDGSFFWNPEQSSLSMWYMDAGNSITQGPVTTAGDTTVMTFRARNFAGEPADLRVTLTRKNNDDYNWLLEEKQPGGWRQLGSLEYLRATGG
ncbi:MAG TPA: hypothetical protein VHE78_08570 [Gemmatimonadaceae bacterium]|nr:hypothetical protein [Gemmatimonadaceae bacterium]